VLGRCSNNRNQVCIYPDACPTAECNPDTNRCTAEDVPCTPCPPDGTCEPLDGFFVAGEPVEIETSPILSSDPFVVIGTPDGRVCARGLDGTVPGQVLTPPTEAWADGCIELPNDNPTRSTPIISAGGQIYVTTDDGLYAIQ
jgi:hypothetical protein